MKVECQSDFLEVNYKLYPCTVSLAMDLIGGKWKAVILYHLRDSNKRYSELRNEMSGVTERTLSLQLKQLEEDGLISRTVFGEKPPIKVIYGLTEFGKTCVPLLTEILNWGNRIAVQKGRFIKNAL